MGHILYLSDSQPICHDAGHRLPGEFVKIENWDSDSPFCWVCSRLLSQANDELRGERLREARYVPPIITPPSEEVSSWGSGGFAKGLMLGLVVSATFWVVLFAIFVVIL